MPSAAKVVVEALVVGVIFTVVFAVVHMADMSLRPIAAMGHQGLGCQAFAAAALGHILFEVSGLNKYYADNYNKN